MNDEYTPDFILGAGDEAEEIENKPAAPAASAVPTAPTAPTVPAAPAAEPAKAEGESTESPFHRSIFTKSPFAGLTFDPSMLEDDDDDDDDDDEFEPEPESEQEAAQPKDEAPEEVPPLRFGSNGYVGEQVRPAYQPKPAEQEPGRKSHYAMMSSWGIFLQIVLMSIPGPGTLLALVWALGGCRKLVRRNIARAYFLTLAFGILALIIGVLVLRFGFPDTFVDVFEYLVPGYTIRLY